MTPASAADVDPGFFVRVEVPTKKGGTQDGGGTHGTTGTGYPVGKDLILTARHVVEPENRDPRYRIRIRWTKFPELGRQGAVELEPDEEAVVWKGKGEHDDLALLRCPERPPEIAVPTWPWARMPRSGMRFDSWGYPRATRLEDPATGAAMPAQNAFSGEIRTSAEPWFEIVDPAAPDEAADWKGASGMPIFTSAGIVGVFSAALREVRGKGHCIPVAPLLKRHPELARLFEDARFDRHWAAFRERSTRKVAAMLGRSRLFTDAIVAELIEGGRCLALEHIALSDDDGKPTATASATAAECLLELDFETFAGIAAIVDRQLRDAALDRGPQDRAQQDALEALLTVTMHLAPVLYDAWLARRAYASSRGAELLELPTVFHTVAELMVAAEEGRAARYQHRKSPNDRDPRGVACLSAAVAELGIDASTADYDERLQVHLGRKELDPCAPPKAFARETFLHDCARFLDSTFYPSERRGSGTSSNLYEPDRLRGVNIGLCDYLDRGGRPVRLYTVFRPESADELEEMRKTAEELHRRYPSLRILFLTAFCGEGDDDNPWDREIARLKAFCQILPFRR